MSAYFDKYRQRHLQIYLGLKIFIFLQFSHTLIKNTYRTLNLLHHLLVLVSRSPFTLTPAVLGCPKTPLLSYVFRTREEPSLSCSLLYPCKQSVTATETTKQKSGFARNLLCYSAEVTTETLLEPNTCNRIGHRSRPKDPQTEDVLLEF